MEVIINESQHKLFLETLRSIPTFKNNSLLEEFYPFFKKRYPETPEYVLKDFIMNNILDNEETINDIFDRYEGDPTIVVRGWWDDFLKGPWSLKILTVNPDDFDDKSVNAFIEREFGEVNSYMVPDDEERTQYQREIAKPDGKNEPIIVTFNEKTGKYGLIEGWHRTMSTLSLGDNGEDLKNWDKVKIRAFVNPNPNLFR